MSTPNDGGPAFPETRWDDKTRQEVQWCGMTLRDWLAAHASDSDVDYYRDFDVWGAATKTREEARYMFADAMLKARNQ